VGLFLLNKVIKNVKILVANFIYTFLLNNKIDKYMAQKLVLLGEDEKNIAEMYEVAFNQAGFNLVLAPNGEEVLQKARELNPDIVLLDINMPVKDGFEVLKEVMENSMSYPNLKGVPIVMLTNYNNTQDVEYCMKMGAQDYIVKSEWTPETIVAKVKKILEKDEVVL
jgi:DNA-binding response OmpR family regulator